MIRHIPMNFHCCCVFLKYHNDINFTSITSKLITVGDGKQKKRLLLVEMEERQHSLVVGIMSTSKDYVTLNKKLVYNTFCFLLTKWGCFGWLKFLLLTETEAVLHPQLSRFVGIRFWELVLLFFAYRQRLDSFFFF